MKTVRLGSGAGYSGDRIDPAVELAKQGDLDYLVFECLAERTIALAQLERLSDPEKGYDKLLATRMREVLQICYRQGTTIITNMGAANPYAAALCVKDIATEIGLNKLKIAYVLGDNVLDKVSGSDYPLLELPGKVADFDKELVSANAYLGVKPIIEALDNGADVIITGRVADPALFLAPLVYEFGWQLDDWNTLGKGTLVGHLLECAGQVTGGYFADPGYKDAKNLATLGFPLAEVDKNGDAVITKVKGSGGKVTVDTCKEQLIYEIHDPSKYLTPDVIADFSEVSFVPDGNDRVRITGAKGSPRPETLKVSIGYRDGFIGEGEISYGSDGAQQRGNLALQIVQERLRMNQIPVQELRTNLIGINSLFPSEENINSEVRIRVAARTKTRQAAVDVANEVESLYTNGPAGGGGARKTVKAVVAIVSTFLEREKIETETKYLER